MVVVSEFHLKIFYYRTIFFILIYTYKNENVNAVRLKINDLRGTDIEGNGWNGFEISKYQRSNLKIKNNRVTIQRSPAGPKELTRGPVKKGKFRSAYLPSTKGKNEKKSIYVTSTPRKILFSTNTTVGSTYQTISKEKKIITTNTKAIIKDKTKSKKKLKVKTSTTKNVELKKNTKKLKKISTNIINRTSKRRIVKKNNNIEITTSKNQQEDEDIELKNVIKTKAINKALDLFSNSLVKSLSDQLWDQFIKKSKNIQNSVPQQNDEDFRVPLVKPVSNILRNKEKLKAPLKENLNDLRQTEESVERFEIML